MTVIVVKSMDSSGLTWVLLSNLPVDETRLAIDCYICRWRIEEWFRTLKEAMGIERFRCFTSRQISRLILLLCVKIMIIEWCREKSGIEAGKKMTKEKRKEMVKSGERAIEIETARWRDGKTPPQIASDEERALMLMGLIAIKSRWIVWTNFSFGNKTILQGLDYILREAEMGHWHWLLTPLVMDQVGIPIITDSDVST